MFFKEANISFASLPPPSSYSIFGKNTFNNVSFPPDEKKLVLQFSAEKNIYKY